MMKNIKLILSTLLLFFSIPLLSTFMGMLNEQSDIAVYSGFTLLGLLAVAVVLSTSVVGSWLLKQLAKRI